MNFIEFQAKLTLLRYQEWQIVMSVKTVNSKEIIHANATI